MTLFFTADLHIFHDNIIKYCNRPFKSIDKMWKAIKNNWNSKVGKNDTVWVAGDLTLKTWKHKQLLAQMMEELNGEKHLILSLTHDLMMAQDYIQIGFTSVHCPATVLENGWWVGHDPTICLAMPPYKVLICGHVHNLMMSDFKNRVFRINVGVDVRNFTPISEDEIREIIATGPEDPPPDSKKGTEESIQDPDCRSRVQQERDISNDQDESLSDREKRWRASRRASIDGPGSEEGNC